MHSRLVTFERCFVLALLSQCLAFIEMCGKGIRSDLQSSINGGKRLIGFLFPNVEDAEIDETLREVRRERSDLQQHLLALLELSLIQVNRSQIRIRRVDVRL